MRTLTQALQHLARTWTGAEGENARGNMWSNAKYVKQWKGIIEGKSRGCKSIMIAICVTAACDPVYNSPCFFFSGKIPLI